MTTIEWAQNPDGSKGESWNPIRARDRATGRPGWFCIHANAACRGCYAEKWNGRLGNGVAYRAQDRDKVDIYLDDKTLAAPLRWKKARRIFVCSMTDLFLKHHPDAWLDRMFAVMALCPQHTFIVLTKRPERMRAYLTDDDLNNRISAALGDMLDGPWIWNEGKGYRDRIEHLIEVFLGQGVDDAGCIVYHDDPMPLPNVWLMVTVHDQPTADAWVPLLLDTPAAVGGLSIEPMLGPIDLTNLNPPSPDVHGWSCIWKNNAIGRPWLDWVIVGGESGVGARPIHPDWARSLRDQCRAAGVPFFFKQWGEFLLGEPTAAPADGNPTGLPLRFQDGETFTVNSDGEDIVYGSAQDEPAGPRQVWRRYWAWQGHLLRRVGKKAAGRDLDGRTWDEFPSQPGQGRVERLPDGQPPTP